MPILKPYDSIMGAIFLCGIVTIGTIPLAYRLKYPLVHGIKRSHLSLLP